MGTLSTLPIETVNIDEANSARLAAMANDSEVVHNSLAETVGGVKTFSSSPIVPTPTTDYQAATKKYVDDNAGGGGGGIDRAMRFDGASGGHVNFGPFIEPGTTISTFWIDMLVCPTDPDQGAEYMLSPGWGGAHVPALIGYISSGGLFSVTGNVWDAGGSATVSFSTPTKFKVGYWHYVAVTFDGSEIKVYVNGVLEAVTAFVSATLTVPAVVDTVLYLGGSNHSKASFDAAWLRIFIDDNPAAPASYAPINLMSNWPKAVYWDGSAFVKASGLWDLTQDVRIIPDLSDGLNGIKHPGIRSSGSDNGNFLNSYPVINLHAADASLPQLVDADYSVGAYEAVSVTIPGTAKVYDSFSTRDTSPYWSATSGLGSSEGGTAGIAAWSATADTYAVSSGSAIPLTTSTTEYAAIEAGSQTQDIRVTVEGTKILITGRHVDSNNFVYGYVYVGSGLLSWEVGKRVAGTFSTIASGSTAGSMPSLINLIISGTAVQLTTDGVSRVNTTDGSMPAGTKAGFRMSTQDLTKISLFEVY